MLGLKLGDGLGASLRKGWDGLSDEIMLNALDDGREANGGNLLARARLVYEVAISSRAPGVVFLRASSRQLKVHRDCTRM